MQKVRARISEKGRVLIPASFREALGLKVGDEVELRIDENELRISTLRNRIREAQQYIRQFVKAGTSLSGELVDERREAARHE